MTDRYNAGRDAYQQSAGGADTTDALYEMVEALSWLTSLQQAQIEALTARVDELASAAREAGAGENTIDYAALEAAERDDPAKQWAPQDEAADEAELPRTLPHQP